MKKILVSLLVLCIFVSGCSNSVKPDSNTTTNTHESLIANKNITKTDTLIHDDPNYIVYFTQNNCSSCKDVDPLVEKFANQNKTYKTYIYDIDPVTWSNTPFYTEDVANDATLRPNLPQPVSNDVKVFYTPTLFVVNNGQITSIGIGNSSEADSANSVLNSLK